MPLQWQARYPWQKAAWSVWQVHCGVPTEPILQVVAFGMRCAVILCPATSNAEVPYRLSNTSRHLFPALGYGMVAVHHKLVSPLKSLRGLARHIRSIADPRNMQRLLFASAKSEWAQSMPEEYHSCILIRLFLRPWIYSGNLAMG